ncbi:MAG TPA: peptidoglycan-binding domain-containing protein [Kofleriaceae bacterium]
MQTRLNERGETVVVDGAFGPRTREAVVRFQHTNGLEADGVVGPLTWAALESAPAASDGPAELSTGDAEGNSDDGGGTDELLTLDRSGISLLPTEGATRGNLLGFSAGAVRPAAVQHVAKPALLSGAFADLGQYRATGDGFRNTDLDELLGLYGTFWGVDVRAPAAPDQNQPTTGTGDSAGKGVAAHPAWVKALQNKIVGRSKWDDDDRATQKIIEAFMRSFARTAGDIPPGAEQLFHQIGASETNGQANSLGGFKGASNWCAQASNFALLLGMYNRGIRFKTDSHSSSYGVEITKQVAQYTAWTKRPGHVISGSSAFTAALAAGDIISVVNGGPTGPLSGHVATVVQAQGDKIVYVSGNAAGTVAFEGAVRVEEVTREQPPDGYNWLQIAQRSNAFAGHKQAEKKSTELAGAKRGQIAERFLFVQDRLNRSGILVPPIDLDSPASLAVLLGIVTSLPTSDPDRSALIGTVQDMIRLQAEAGADGASAAASRAAQTAMLGDGGLPVNRDDRRFVPGVHAPISPTSSWVVEVIKASGLTQAQVLASGAVSVEPADPMLEKGPRLADQCPDAPPEVVNQQAR